MGPRRPAVYLLTPTLVTGDAVSRDVLGMYAALRSAGHPATIFTQTNVDLALADVKDIRAFGRRSRDVEALMIYHYSTHWELGLAAYQGFRGRRVLKYHNVTPAEYFEPYSVELATTCAAGLLRLPEVVGLETAAFWCDSPFNASELVHHGAAVDAVFTLPPFVDAEARSASPSDVEILRRYLDGRTNLLFVGRVAPNKGHRHLLRVLATYRTAHDPSARLFIVGNQDPRLRGYQAELDELARQGGLNGAVVYTGRVTDAQLKAFYLLAHAFICASEHEGFCVPLVEAMESGVPIVALARTSVPFTVGSAGLVWERLDYTLFSESLRELRENAPLVDELATRGRARFAEEFGGDVIRDRFLQLTREAWATPGRG